MSDERTIKPRQVKVYGSLYFKDKEFFLLSPFALKKAHDSWMSDSMHMFHVLTSYGRETHIVVQGEFLISYGNAGEVKEVSLDSVFPALAEEDKEVVIDGRPI
jgi:hypothetical protein